MTSMRRATLRGLAACALATACGPPDVSTPAPAPDSYLNDAAFRRSELVRSLVNAGNGYSKLRLEHYATGADGDWERLPEWNPGVSPVTVDELGQTASAPAPSDERELTLPEGITDEDDPRLVVLGRTAFERYPVQLAPYLGKAQSDASSAPFDPSSPIPSWGPGRLDVTTTAGTEPVQIADLRPVGFLGYLHKDATVAVLDRTALAIRIETLLVTTYGQVLRQPRYVADANAA
jgi:hypothetical protein